MRGELSTSDRLKRGCIQLQLSNPFFAYLSLFLKFKEDKNLPKTALAGVNAQGEFFYRDNSFDNVSDDELVGVITHEILHLSLLHLIRGKDKDLVIVDSEGNPTFLFNIASDICVNQLLKDNNFKCINGTLVSDNNNEIELFGKKIVNCNKKTAEEIYDELYTTLKNDKKIKQISLAGLGGDKSEDVEGKSSQTGLKVSGKPIKSIDKHYRSEGLTEQEKREVAKEWTDRLMEAYTSAKIRGNVPAGIERLIGKLHESRIDWKQLLKRYIEEYIPYDYTYSRANKKSVSTGFFMPDTIKERINVSIMIDVSGSIGIEELSDFLSEIIGLAKAYRSRINMKLYTHETEINDEFRVENGDVEKIKNIKIHGGGGTSFNPVLKEFNKRNKDNKLILWLTDGYGDKIDRQDIKCDIIWVISKNGDDDLVKDTGRVIKLK